MVVSLWPLPENKDYVRRVHGLPLFEWLGRHLNNNGNLGDLGAWKEYFVVTIWWIWRRRNEGIFNDKMIAVRDKVGTIQRHEKEITAAQMNQVLAKGFQVQHCTKLIGWAPPNLDGLL